MAEQYVHTLIALPKDFVPTAAQVAAFLADIVERGVIPGPMQLVLRRPTGKTRTVVNPITRQTIAYGVTSHQELGGVDQVEANVSELTDYELEVAGQGRPRTPPLPIDFDEPYHVAVRARVSSVLRSTSYLNLGTEAATYGEPCSSSQSSGFFTNPHNSETIKVPGAGCARFWVEVELGKFLFPEIQYGSLDILNPAIVTAATKSFGVPFVQGLGPNA